MFSTIIMNNNNKFKKRGQDLLNELKKFTDDVNRNTNNKQTQLDTILFEITTIEKQIKSIEDDFFDDYRKIVGQEFVNKPVDFPKIMKMDGYLIKIRLEKNKQNRIRQLEQNKLNANQKRANEAKTLNISQKTDFIKSEIKRLRQNIGNSNASSNNNAQQISPFNNRFNEKLGVPLSNNVRPNYVPPPNSHPLSNNSFNLSKINQMIENASRTKKSLENLQQKVLKANINPNRKSKILSNLKYKINNPYWGIQQRIQNAGNNKIKLQQLKNEISSYNNRNQTNATKKINILRQINEKKGF